MARWRLSQEELEERHEIGPLILLAVFGGRPFIRVRMLSAAWTVSVPSWWH